MSSLALFCLSCQTYIGESERCALCGQTRDQAQRLSVPLWRFDTEKKIVRSMVVRQDRMFVVVEDGMIYVLDLKASDENRLLARITLNATLRRGLVAREHRLYMVTREGAVLAVDIKSGEIVWRFHTKGKASALSADDRLFYVGDAEGNVYALADAGDHAEVALRAKVGQRISAAPTRWGHLILVATHHNQGHLFALDVSRGGEVWQPHPLGDRVSHPPLIEDERVLIITDKGAVNTFRLTDTDGKPDGSSQVSSIFAAPVADSDSIYFGASDGRVFALPWAMDVPCWKKPTQIGGNIAGLALWQDLLFVNASNGIHAVEAKTGEIKWRHPLTSRVTSSLVAADGRVYASDGSSVIALPWHGRQWAWAAQRCADRYEHHDAASFFALAKHPAAAECEWAPDDLRWAGRMWDGIGEDKPAAQAFMRTAEAMRLATPAQAAAFFNRAAKHFKIAKQTPQAEECARLAGRMGNFALFELDLLNLTTVEAGEPGSLTVRLTNVGKGAARNIKFYLGAAKNGLAYTIKGELAVMDRDTDEILDFENLIPTTPGEVKLRLLITYRTADDPSDADSVFLWQVNPPPPNAITTYDDTGLIVVKVPEGAPPPSVRARRMVGAIHYIIVPKGET